MSNFFSLFGSDKDKRNQNVFSLDKLHKLYARLVAQKHEATLASEETAKEHNSRELVVETIRQITEALLWGEKHDSAFFDYFCEKNILSEFVEVLALDCPRTVKIQLLQTLSMLVQNIRKKTSLYYIFSNNHLNMLIGRRLDWKDEEILAYYITLLKSLAVRLNEETVNFFFKPHEQEFPLYSEAIRFFNHRDQMIRAAIRTLTLQIYRIEDPGMRNWVVKRGGYYFTHLACYTRDLWMRLNSAVMSTNRSFPRIKEAMDQVDDLHIYLNDAFAVGIKSLNEALGERLLVYAIYPFLIGALVRGVPSTTSDTTSYQNSTDIADNYVLGRSVGIYLLQRVLNTFTVQSVIAPLVETLISKHLSTSISSFCYGKIAPCPASYPDLSGTSCSFDGEITSQMSDQLTIHLPHATDGVTLNNPFRAKLLKLILVHQANDLDLFLATTVIHSLVTKKIIPRQAVEESGLIPAAYRRTSQSTSSKDGMVNSFLSSTFGPTFSSTSTSSSDDGKDQKLECLREIILPMCQAFQYPNKLRSLTFLVLHRTITEIILSQPHLPPNWMPMIVEIVAIAARKCAMELKETLKSSFGSSLVEFFLKHWELQKMAIVDIHAIMDGTEILVPSRMTEGIGTDPLDWIDPNDQLEPSVAAFRRMRCFLILRRFHRAMVLLANKTATRQTLLGPILDPLPFDVSADVSGDNKDGLVEGDNIELTKKDLIMCSLLKSKSSPPRYLLNHQSMVILVEPDVASAGWGTIRTLCPTRCVEPYIDRGDPRTLNLYITQTGVPPGEATSFSKGQSQPSYTLELSFSDTRRCHLAQCQINESRKAMQVDMLHKLTKFVDQHC